MANKQDDAFIIPMLSAGYTAVCVYFGSIPLALLGGAITVGGAVNLFLHRDKKLEKMLDKCNVKNGEALPRLIKKQKNGIGTRYLFTIPTGMCIKDFENKEQEIAQALKQDIEIKLVNNLASIQTIEQDFVERCNINLEGFRGRGMKFAVGVDRVNRTIDLDLTGADTHTLVVGATGSGKSVAINVLIVQMILAGIELSLIDLKAVEFVLYQDYRNLKGFAIDGAGAYKVLQDTVAEMNRRYDTLLQARCKNYQDYNTKYPKTKIKPRVLIIDEFQSLFDDKECKKLLFMLLTKARAANIIIILSCQSPRYDIVDGKLRDNIKNYLIFKCETPKASEVATGTQGDYRAINLPGEGRGLLKAKGKYTEFQGAILTDEEILHYIEPFNGCREAECDNGDYGIGLVEKCNAGQNRAFKNDMKQVLDKIDTL